LGKPSPFVWAQPENKWACLWTSPWGKIAAPLQIHEFAVIS
jgi:hypothetical protein